MAKFFPRIKEEIFDVTAKEFRFLAALIAVAIITAAVALRL
jgi:Flp pilus assembly pilin Flp